MNRIIIATTFALASLAATPAAGHVIRGNDAVGLKEEYDVDEVLSIKHQCSEVPVRIHAQNRTMERMIESCRALKWAADYFHAMFQTNRDNPIVIEGHEYYNGDATMDMYVFDGPENARKYGGSLSCGSYDPSLKYAELCDIRCSSRANNASCFDYDLSGDLGIEVHEYTHHLDYMYNGERRQPVLWREGLAEYMRFQYRIGGKLSDYGGWYGFPKPISSLKVDYHIPPLGEFADSMRRGALWRNLLDTFGRVATFYEWGEIFFHFLHERNHQAELLKLRNLSVADTHRLGRLGVLWLHSNRASHYDDDYVAQIYDVLEPLEQDWLDYLQPFVPKPIMGTSNNRFLQANVVL